MTRSRLSPFVGGSDVAVAGPSIELVSPVDGGQTAAVAEASEDDVARAVESAHAAYRAHRFASVAARADWLNRMADAIDRQTDRIVEAMIRTIGKPRRAATFEARRTAQFVRLCAAQVLTMGGEVLPLDAVPAGADRFGFTRRIPYGVIGAITPFNAPANLLMQKVAPAIAMGNAVVAKPIPSGSEVALIIARACAESGLPAGLFNVVTGDRIPARALAAHPLVRAVTVTGGTAAGDALARAAGAKKFIAELGSNAANVVCADADLDDAAKRIAAAAFEASGQQCISAQRIIVEDAVHDRFVAAFTAAARSLRCGDPWDEATDVGPMVGAAAADRVESLIADAVGRGARLALAPSRNGCLVTPAIVVDAPDGTRLLTEEAFGPVAVVQRARDVDDAFRIANESRFGLQAACFTARLDTALKASRELDSGSLWINEASRFRLDMYPFGGTGDSGMGREGVRYAMEELSQWKFTGIRMAAV